MKTRDFEEWRVAQVESGATEWWWYVTPYYLVWTCGKHLPPIAVYYSARDCLKSYVTQHAGKRQWQTIPELLADYRRVTMEVF